MRNREIGELFDVSEQTVKNHVSSILHKLGVPNRVRAVTFAARQGWLTLGDVETRCRRGSGVAGRVVGGTTAS